MVRVAATVSADRKIVFFSVVVLFVTICFPQEVIRDSLSPQWTAHIAVDYMFELVQEMVVKVFHFNASRGNTDQEDRHDLIGEVRFEIGRLMRTNGQVLVLRLTGPHAEGASIEIRAESQTGTRDLLCVSFSGNKLANKDGFFGTSDPFLVISRLNEDNTYTTVWKVPFALSVSLQLPSKLIKIIVMYLLVQQN